MPLLVSSLISERMKFFPFHLLKYQSIVPKLWHLLLRTNHINTTYTESNLMYCWSFLSFLLSASAENEMWLPCLLYSFEPGLKTVMLFWQLKLMLYLSYTSITQLLIKNIYWLVEQGFSSELFDRIMWHTY